MFSKVALLAGTAAIVNGIPWDPKTGKTMNGKYTFANPTKDQPEGLHRGTDYFEVVTPSYYSTYAEVNWGSFTVPLDPEVVKELDGKLINFVGYEFDLVRKGPNGTHVSVPAWELYNHHYGNSIIGKGVKVVKTGIPTDLEDYESGEEQERHHPGYKFVNTNPKTGLREEGAQFSSGGLIIGNGAESRKTFHQFAPGYGVFVESPTSANIHPMIIDTINREGGGTAQRPTGHGKVPNASTVNPDQMYSPIHECPCTDKWTKKISSYSTQKAGTCNPLITTPAMCFAAAVELGLKPVKNNMTVNNPKVPSGCSVTPTSGGYEIVFNTNAAPTATCGKPVSTPSGPPLDHTCNLTGAWMDMRAKAVYNFVAAGTNKYNVMSRGRVAATISVAAPSTGKPEGTVSGIWGKNTIPANINTWGAAGSPPCSQLLWANSADFVLMPYATKAPVPEVPPRVAGLVEDLTNITVDIDPSKDMVTITLQGPSDVWYGAGFGYHHVSTGGADPSVGVSMVGCNWTIVVLGNGTVTERDLGNHEPGKQLPDTVTLVSNTVVDGSRTVVVTRSIKGAKTDDYFFNPLANQLTYINAIGGTPDLEYHVKKTSGVLYFVELDYPTCICNFAGDQGTIGGYSWGTQRCVGRPLGQMLDDPVWANENPPNVNPTCSIHSYRGGLRCCKGGTIILDSDQTVKNNVVMEWQLKYRYYYEVVEDPAKVQNTFMTSWWTEHNNGEHDVPKCTETDQSKCVNQISSNFTAGMMGGCANGCQFVTMEGHCHIGCIGMEMWIMDDPKNPVLLCNATNTYGTDDGWMNEMGYIAGSNTCLFGPNGTGYNPLVSLHPTTKLMSVKLSNNTNPYTGDMGLWEINAAPLPKDFRFPEEL